VPAPPVAPPPPPPAPTPPRPRAAAPQIVAACATSDETDGDDETTSLCGWDDGFPAISGDGTMIAIKEWTGSEEASLTVRVVDARTLRDVRWIAIGDGDAHERIVNDETMSDARRDKALRRYRERVKRRAATAQRWLDRARFRSLVSLGSRYGDEPSSPGAGRLQAEIVGTWARVIDTRESTVVLQADFGVTAPDRHDEECVSWDPAEAELWWDARSRTAVGVWLYHTGGCMCPSDQVVVVKRQAV